MGQAHTSGSDYPSFQVAADSCTLRNHGSRTASRRRQGWLMQNKLFDLSGRVALVTGGSKGLGAAMARAFAAAGADVLICSRHEEELKVAAAGIAADSGVRVE